MMAAKFAYPAHSRKTVQTARGRNACRTHPWRRLWRMRRRICHRIASNRSAPPAEAAATPALVVRLTLAPALPRAKHKGANLWVRVYRFIKATKLPDENHFP